MQFKALVAVLLVAGATPALAATNLITNGNFAAGMAGWTTNSNAFFTDANGYHEGAVGFGASLSQTFSSTASLTLDFDYGGNAFYQFVEFNGNTVAGSLINNPSAFAHYTFALGTGIGVNTLTFVGRNDPSYNTLTNVSVAAVPEPAMWTLLIGGFAMTGVSMRRRNTAVVA